MDIYAKITKRFKDVFTKDEEQSYEEFAKWYIDESHMSDSTVIKWNSVVWTENTPFVLNGENKVYLDVPGKKTFYLIANEYNDSSLAHSVEGFKEHFANDLYTFYKEFEATTKAINELMSLTDDQIKDAGSMVTNTADIPENTYDTDKETVDFISNQQKMLNLKGDLQVKREQLANKRAYTTRAFLAKFKHLFIKILSSPYNFMVVEDEHY